MASRILSCPIVLILHLSNVTYSLKSIAKETFHGNLIYSLPWGLNRGLTTYKPLRYLLDYENQKRARNYMSMSSQCIQIFLRSSGFQFPSTIFCLSVRTEILGSPKSSFPWPLAVYRVVYIPFYVNLLPNSMVAGRPSAQLSIWISPRRHPQFPKKKYFFFQTQASTVDTTVGAIQDQQPFFFVVLTHRLSFLSQKVVYKSHF